MSVMTIAGNRGQGRKGRRGNGQTRTGARVVRVMVGSDWIGDVHLDGRNRVRSRAASVPADIVLKLLVQATRRGESDGVLVGGPKDSREFTWFVVAPEQDCTAEQESAEAA
jgi:hypothetical protein